MSSFDSKVFIVKDGDFTEVREEIDRTLGGPWEVEIRPYVPKRSTLQNRLYWEYMTQLGDYTGHTKDEMSLFFKWKFLGSDKTEVYGQSFNAVKSTTDLNVKEFNEFLRSIEVFASEQGFMFKAPPYYGDV